MNKSSLIKRAFTIYRERGFVQLLQSILSYTNSRISSNSTIFHLKSVRNYYKNRIFHGVCLKPYEKLYVKTDRITKINNEITNSGGLIQIKGGGWDEEAGRFEASRTYIGLKQKFEKGYDWKDTEYVQMAREDIQETGDKYGYDDIDSFIKNRCKYIEDIYRSMKTDGYIETDAVINHGTKHMGRGSEKSKSYHPLEPLIAISRDGDLQLQEGRHRVSIAKIIGIEEIPVHLLRLHNECQLINDLNEYIELERL